MKRIVKLVLVIIMLSSASVYAEGDDFAPLARRFADYCAPIIAAGDVATEGLYTHIDDWFFNAHEHSDNLYIVSVMSNNNSASSTGVIDMLTGEVVVPFEYLSLNFIPQNKLFGIVDNNPHVVYDYSYFEIDLYGNKIELDLPIPDDTYAYGADSKGYVTYWKYADGGGYLLGLLDSSYNVVLDPIIDSVFPSMINFEDGYATVQTGGEWTYHRVQFAESDGKYGIINRKGEWVLEPKYDYLDYYGYGKYYATLDGNVLFIDANGNDLHLEHPSYDPSDWAAPEVSRAIELGLYRGIDRYVPMAYYAYEWNITRQQFCELAVDLYKVAVGELPTVENTDTFTDTNNVDILAAYELGIVKGYSDGTFRPFADITRQEAAIMLSRLASVLGIEPTAEPLSFTDGSTMYAEGIVAIRTVSAMGIMNGVGQERFAPNEHYTVEQAVCTMVRLYESVAR